VTKEKVMGNAKRPNILFIMGDDHTSQAWSCYGSRLSRHIETPHIDRIAREGARLENCFVTNALCVPSRATILTGQYSHHHGATTLQGEMPRERDHVAKRLKEAGYETAIVGKWHLKREPSGFDYYNVLHGQGSYFNPRLENSRTDEYPARGILRRCDRGSVAEVAQKAGRSRPAVHADDALQTVPRPVQEPATQRQHVQKHHPARAAEPVGGQEPSLPRIEGG
jgi:arylsulfatase A-like enzyme